MYITDYKPVALKSLNFSNEDDRAFYTSFDRNQDGVISWVEQNEFLVRTGQGTLDAPAPTGRTPALLVPDTPQGKFYNSIPDLIRQIAQSVDNQVKAAAGKPLFDLKGNLLFNGSKDRLEQLLNESIGQYSYDQVKTIGFAAFAELIKNLPLFPTPDIGEPFDLSPSKSALEVQVRKLPNGGFSLPVVTAYAMLGRILNNDFIDAKKEAKDYFDPKVFYDFAYGVCFNFDVASWMTYNPPVGLFGLDAMTKLIGQISQLLDRNSTGGAWAYFGADGMIRRIAERWVGATGIEDLNDVEFGTRSVPIVYTVIRHTDEWGLPSDVYSKIIGEESLERLTPDEVARIKTERLFDGEIGYYDRYSVESSIEEKGIWNKKTGRWISKVSGWSQPYVDLGGWGEGEGMTYAAAYWYPGSDRLSFQTTGKATGLKAFLSSDLFKVLSIGLAVWGIGAALASISTTGLTVGNVAQLTASVNNLPGVDLGLVGDIASGLSAGMKLAATIPGQSVILNADALEIPESELTMFDDFDVYDVPDVTGPVLDFDPGDFNFIDITGVDLGGELFIDPIDIGVNLDEVVVMELGELGLDTAMLGIDLDGSVYDIQGEVTAPTMRTYAASLYIGSDGGIYDIANTQLLTPAQAETAFNEGGIDELTAQTWAAASSQGATFVAQQANEARPASNPAVKSTGILPTFSGDSWGAFLLNAASTLGNFALAREQIQRTGRYTPPGQTSTYGTAYPTRVGVPQAQPDGSVVIRNQDGSVTRTNIDGSQSTIRPGQTGGMLGGVSTNTLLIGGGILAAVLLLRK